MHKHAIDYGVELSLVHLDLFEAYLEELIEWNSRMNLTGLGERGRMISELFLDSLMPVPYLPSRGKMLDVGSGAGFPAIVIKILIPDLELHLVEANSKKVSFLKQVVRLLKLNRVEVMNKRIETIDRKSYPDGFDVITSRAMANFNQIIDRCAPLLAGGGHLLYFSGSKVDENLKNAEDLMKDHGLTIANLVPYHLPGMKDDRNVVILKNDMS